MKQRTVSGPVHIVGLPRLDGAALARMAARSDWHVIETFWRRLNEDVEL
jgi:hypothetical protein